MRYFTIAVLLFLCSFANAQQNLVPNPSFEDTVYCPYGLDQIDACVSWTSFGGSPDYFNSCAAGGLNVPNSVLGYQYANNGNGMVGIATYADPNSTAGPNAREFIGCQLLTPLVVGQKYYFSFYANFSNYGNVSIATNKLGVTFFMQPYSSCCRPILNNNPIFYSDSILKDSVAWIKFESSFIADSNYQYISIGNFFVDQFTDTLNIGSFPYAAYYYIDDVCVTLDSLYNHSWTGIIKKSKTTTLEIYPNPSNSILNIVANLPIQSISLVDIAGRECTQLTKLFLNEKHLSVVLSYLKGGAYFAIIKLKDNEVFTKAIIISP